MRYKQGMPATFGARVARFRKHRRLTQEGLAKLSGVSRTHLARIETGRADPSLTVLLRLAAALGLRVADLVEPDDSPATRTITRRKRP
jgi:transcriptional regulator with XRE-family HTH domain